MPCTHSISLPVLPADIDALGHVNNVTYLRWVQQVAEAHWYHLAPPDIVSRYLWIVLRHEIDYRQSAQLGDTVRVVTTVGPASRARIDRLTDIYRESDSTLLAQARTVWCPLRPDTRRPTGMTAELLNLFQ